MPLRLKMAPDPPWGPTCSSTTMALGADLSPGWLQCRTLSSATALGMSTRASGKLRTVQNHLFDISSEIHVNV